MSVDDLAVMPYPKPLALDNAALTALAVEATSEGSPKPLVDPSRLGTVSSGGHLCLIVVLDPGGNHPFMPDNPSSELGRFRLLTRVSFAATYSDRASLDAMATMAEQVPFLLMPRLKLAEACDRISQAFEEAL